MSLRSLENAPAPSRPHTGAVQRLSEQYEDIDQQNESYMVGMWSFLVTEIMFFGALFLAYSVYRVLYYQAYLDAHHFLQVFWGGMNTFILLSSSFSMVLAVNAAQQGKFEEDAAPERVATLKLSFVILPANSKVQAQTVFLPPVGVEIRQKPAEPAKPAAGEQSGGERPAPRPISKT